MARIFTGLLEDVVSYKQDGKEICTVYQQFNDTETEGDLDAYIVSVAEAQEDHEIDVMDYMVNSLGGKTDNSDGECNYVEI